MTFTIILNSGLMHRLLSPVIEDLTETLWWPEQLSDAVSAMAHIPPVVITATMNHAMMAFTSRHLVASQ